MAEKVAENTETVSIIPADRESNIDERKEGYEYLIVTIHHKPGLKFGLGVKNVYRNLFIIKVDENTIVSGLFNVSDRILDVDGSFVSDLVKCKTLLVKGLKEKKVVSVLVERAVDERAKKAAMDEMNEEHTQSVMVPPDVKSIMRRMGERMATNGQTIPESALTKNSKDRKPCQVEEGHKSVMIQMDNENNVDKLKKVAKKE